MPSTPTSRTAAEAAAEAEPLVQAAWQMVKHYIILNVCVYAFCFAVEGAMRWEYGIDSETHIRETIVGRGPQAKALVARDKQIAAMEADIGYIVYFCVILFGTPIAMVVITIHDFRFARRVTKRWWFGARLLVLGFVAMFLVGTFLTLIGPSLAAMRFYDRVSPRDLLEGRR